MDGENKGKSFGVGGYRGRIILLGDGTEVLTDSDDTEMFDNADEDKDLESQVSKTSDSSATGASSTDDSAKTETKETSTTESTSSSSETKSTETKPEEEKSKTEAVSEEKKE
jgi:protein phosphatase 2C family protein 2/3